MTYPIPATALDDRLGWLGTSGSGKTYNAGGGVERLLQSGARVVIVDPLGVWWGLRLLADGKTPSPFNVAIFGGPHGDLPLNEHVGALIGETAATMAESCIIDLSEFASKSADRRFMAAFLETLYRKAGGEPFHLIVDEADLFAPQKPGKGDETLLGHMENIVRRGRVKGFIPWLISQRPAVLNKNVLSQVDGLIAFMLTASHDRNALDAWIEGQADPGQGKQIKDALPTLPVGSGVVWLPRRAVLATATFPSKITFDSSRTPKRGEKRERRDLRPLDLGALKDRLATVEAEARASDPRALKAEVARLTRELAAKNVPGIIPAPAWPDQRADVEALTSELTECVAAMERLRAGAETLQRRQQAALAALTGEAVAIPEAPRPAPRAPTVAPARPQRQAAPVREPRQSDGPTELNSIGHTILENLRRIHPARLTWTNAGLMAGRSPKSGPYFAAKKQLIELGLVEVEGQWVRATDGEGGLGRQEAINVWRATLSGFAPRMLAALSDEQPRSRQELGDELGLSIKSGPWFRGLKDLRERGLTSDSDGYIRLVTPVPGERPSEVMG